ncbi:MAG: hypothetical protein O9288_16675 [Novosphingobium sp.]|nr:hypothetical protein [Novosphingobium sp.]
MARVRKKAVDVVLTDEQLSVVNQAFHEARRLPHLKQWHEEKRNLAGVFKNGLEKYKHIYDYEANEFEIHEIFSDQHKRDIVEYIDYFNDVKLLSKVWNEIAISTKLRLFEDIKTFAVSCGADEVAVASKIDQFDFQILRDGGLQVPTRGKGRPSPYPGQWEATVCLLQIWIKETGAFEPGRIDYEDGTLTPSPVVCFVSKYMTHIDPDFSISKNEKPIEEQKLRRAHRIIMYIKDAGKVRAKPPKPVAD